MNFEPSKDPSNAAACISTQAIDIENDDKW